MGFYWWADDGPLLVVFVWIISSTKKNDDDDSHKMQNLILPENLKHHKNCPVAVIKDTKKVKRFQVCWFSFS